jgi:hypothetical protein
MGAARRQAQEEKARCPTVPRTTDSAPCNPWWPAERCGDAARPVAPTATAGRRRPLPRRTVPTAPRTAPDEAPPAPRPVRAPLTATPPQPHAGALATVRVRARPGPAAAAAKGSPGGPRRRRGLHRPHPETRDHHAAGAAARLLAETAPAGEAGTGGPCGHDAGATGCGATDRRAAASFFRGHARQQGYAAATQRCGSAAPGSGSSG